MKKVYRILAIDLSTNWHAYPIGWVEQQDDGVYHATWYDGRLTACGNRMTTSYGNRDINAVHQAVKAKEGNVVFSNME